MYLFTNKIKFINKILQKNKSYIYYKLHFLIYDKNLFETTTFILWDFSTKTNQDYLIY